MVRFAVLIALLGCFMYVQGDRQCCDQNIINRLKQVCWKNGQAPTGLIQKSQAHGKEYTLWTSGDFFPGQDQIKIAYTTMVGNTMTGHTISKNGVLATKAMPMKEENDGTMRVIDTEVIRIACVLDEGGVSAFYKCNPNKPDTFGTNIKVAKGYSRAVVDKIKKLWKEVGLEANIEYEVCADY